LSLITGFTELSFGFAIRAGFGMNLFLVVTPLFLKETPFCYVLLYEGH